FSMTRSGRDSPGVSNTREIETRNMRAKFLLSVTKLADNKNYSQAVWEVNKAKEKGRKSSRGLSPGSKIGRDLCTRHRETCHGERAQIRYHVHKEELLAMLHDTHPNTGHGGQTCSLKELQGKYGSVTKEVIVLYLTLWKQCHQKNAVPKRGLAPKPMPFKDVDSRCPVEVLEMQSSADAEFKFILCYPDRLTTFITLQPLKAKEAHEVVCARSDVFTILGTASMLESAHGVELPNQVVNELSEAWPDLKITSLHAQCLLRRHHSRPWAEGLPVTRNQAFDVSLQQSPHEARFGHKAKFGLYSSHLALEMEAVLQADEELEIAEEQLESSLWIRQEERAEAGADRSDMDKDVIPTPPKAAEPSTHKGPQVSYAGEQTSPGWALTAPLGTV
uniref:Uncharacterized protein n=1 Tax=Sus scrofa TaxID=9823 RepID=A0A8W4FE34_PIG